MTMLSRAQYSQIITGALQMNTNYIRPLDLHIFRRAYRLACVLTFLLCVIECHVRFLRPREKWCAF